MGTEITLTLNDINIDWGKNRHWTSHHWLFPPRSLTAIEYRYANEVSETKPGFETTLDETLFRLRHLGYSHQEAKTRFDTAATRWNRSAHMRLTFEQFHRALNDINFASLTTSDLAAFEWDFRLFVLDRLSAWDVPGANLEDFVRRIDVAILLRVLADRPENRSLPLRWQHQDLIDSGWVTLEDLAEVDREVLLINHNALFGRLHDHIGATTVKEVDNWLSTLGLPQTTPYIRTGPHGTTYRQMLTLPAAVRHMTHHPENPCNTLTDNDLRESIELLLDVAKRLPTPLTDLT